MSRVGKMSELSFTFLESIRGRKLLKYDSFLFHLQRSLKSDKTFWYCIRRKRKCCKAKVALEKGKISIIRDTHNHEPETKKIQYKSFMKELKSVVTQNASAPVTKIYKNHISKLAADTDAASRLPSYNSVKTALYNARGLARQFLVQESNQSSLDQNITTTPILVKESNQTSTNRSKTKGPVIIEESIHTLTDRGKTVDERNVEDNKEDAKVTNILLNVGDNLEQEVLNVDVDLRRDPSSFETTINSSECVRENGDSPIQKVLDCMKSLSEIVTTKDENSVFGEYVANKMRRCKRTKEEVSLAQRYINDILFRLDMGMLAAEIPSIVIPHVPPPPLFVLPNSYCSNPFRPTASGTARVRNVQLRQ